jgi:hypothetical protein
VKHPPVGLALKDSVGGRGGDEEGKEKRDTRVKMGERGDKSNNDWRVVRYKGEGEEVVQ